MGIEANYIIINDKVTGESFAYKENGRTQYYISHHSALGAASDIESKNPDWQCEIEYKEL